MRSFPSASLRRLERWLLRLFACACRFPRTTLLVLCAWTVGSFVALPRLSTVVSVSDLLDEGFESLADFQTLQRDFGLGETALVLFQRKDAAPLEAHDLCAVSKTIREFLGTSPDVKSVRSPFDTRRAMLSDNRLLYPPYVSLACEAGAHLGPLDRALVEEGAREPAVGVFPGGPLTPLYKSVYGPAFVDSKGTRLLAHVEFEDAKGRARMGRFDPQHVRALQARLDANVPGFLKVSVSGLARHQEQLLKGIEDDRFLNIAAVALLLGIARVLSGRFLGGLLLVATLLVTGVLVYGTMALAGGSVDMLTNGLFILLSVATLQDFLFLADDLRRRPVSAWHGSFRRLITPSFFTSLTTVIGFGSLIATEPVIIRTFGAYAALGVTCEWILVFLGLPALLTLFPRLRVWSAPVNGKAQKQIHRLAAYVPSKRVVVAALAVVPFAGAGLIFLKAGDSPLEAFPSSHPHRQTMMEIRDAFGFETEVSLVFPVFQGAAGAAFHTASSRAMEALKARPEVGALISPWEVQDTFTAGLPEGHAALALRTVRKDDAAKRLFVLSAAAQKSDALMQNDGAVEKARALVLLADSSSEAVEALQAVVKQECPRKECALVGEAVAFADFTRQVTQALIESLFVGLALATIVLVALGIALRQKQGMSLLVASLWGPLVTVGLLPLLPVRINFVTCIFASVVVGLAGDNAVQYWFASRSRSIHAGLDARGDASIQMGLCMVLASLLLCFSSFVPPRVLGLLLALSFVLMTAGDLFLARGLLAWGHTRRIALPLPIANRDR
ncbi:MAG: MMPL family transporter [Silvanigrellales bacterium]|nr:MMPL family transporter [Silvanigrellales bacterium]